jgi:hypothetical protein
VKSIGTYTPPAYPEDWPSFTCSPLVGQAGGAVGGGVRVIDGAAAGVLTLIVGVGAALVEDPAPGFDPAADVEVDDAQPATAAAQISAATAADSRPAPDLLALDFTAVASMSGGVVYTAQSH